MILVCILFLIVLILPWDTVVASSYLHMIDSRAKVQTGQKRGVDSKQDLRTLESVLNTLPMAQHSPLLKYPLHMHHSPEWKCPFPRKAADSSHALQCRA